MNTHKDLCQDSGGTFKTPKLLKIYFHVNHNQTLTKCNFCEGIFLNKEKIYNHMRKQSSSTTATSGKFRDQDSQMNHYETIFWFIQPSTGHTKKRVCLHLLESCCTFSILMICSKSEKTTNHLH